jgi:hypothetical protein
MPAPWARPKQRQPTMLDRQYTSQVARALAFRSHAHRCQTARRRADRGQPMPAINPTRPAAKKVSIPARTRAPCRYTSLTTSPSCFSEGEIHSRSIRLRKSAADRTAWWRRERSSLGWVPSRMDCIESSLDRQIDICTEVGYNVCLGGCKNMRDAGGGTS